MPQIIMPPGAPVPGATLREMLEQRAAAIAQAAQFQAQQAEQRNRLMAGAFQSGYNNTFDQLQQRDAEASAASRQAARDDAENRRWTERNQAAQDREDARQTDLNNRLDKRLETQQMLATQNQDAMLGRQLEVQAQRAQFEQAQFERESKYKQWADTKNEVRKLMISGELSPQELKASGKILDDLYSIDGTPWSEEDKDALRGPLYQQANEFVSQKLSQPPPTPEERLAQLRIPTETPGVFYSIEKRNGAETLKMLDERESGSGGGKPVLKDDEIKVGQDEARLRAEAAANRTHPQVLASMGGREKFIQDEIRRQEQLLIGSEANDRARGRQMATPGQSEQAGSMNPKQRIQQELLALRQQFPDPSKMPPEVQQKVQQLMQAYTGGR